MSEKVHKTDEEWRAELTPAQVQFVEAHGTGTALGDPIEVAALTEAFRAGKLGVMDYYKMDNIQSDTAMRQSIAQPEQKK